MRLEMPEQCKECDGKKECFDCDVRRKWMLDRMGESKCSS